MVLIALLLVFRRRHSSSGGDRLNLCCVCSVANLYLLMTRSACIVVPPPFRSTDIPLPIFCERVSTQFAWFRIGISIGTRVLYVITLRSRCAAIVAATHFERYCILYPPYPFRLQYHTAFVVSGPSFSVLSDLSKPFPQCTKCKFALRKIGQAARLSHLVL
jgi:hypothetical protein